MVALSDTSLTSYQRFSSPFELVVCHDQLTLNPSNVPTIISYFDDSSTFIEKLLVAPGFTDAAFAKCSEVTQVSLFNSYADQTLHPLLVH